MFEVGKTYGFRVMDGQNVTTFVAEVEAYNHPLLKLKETEAASITIEITGDQGTTTSVIGGATSPARILNVASSAFIEASYQG